MNETKEKILLTNGVEIETIASFENNFGTKFYIALDDGCYVLCNPVNFAQDRIEYTFSSWIFPEALKAFKNLPEL